uniref:Uncharacterized protein n=1 Tax=Avena sativa TaxID=4498 RepID=A0ACD5UJ52_AVESA
MNSHTIDEKLFYREANCLMMTDHQNVVRFLGFCASTHQVAIQIEGSREHIYAEVRERLLCFEYISNGSLQKYITDEFRGLEWDTRYEIIRGMCEGLHHLHKEKGIYHMDLKPSNILLDNHMVPKITDFGISRLDQVSKTMSNDRHGSPGYCAPEYLISGKMSFKSDVYSLGVIIIQLVTGVKGIPNNNNEIDPCKRPFIWDIIQEIREMKGVDGEISNADELTLGEIRPYSKDDMLGIEPLELHFPFELHKKISSTLELTNETDACIAFNINSTSPLPYCIEPSKGIVPPRSKCSVKITLQSQKKAPEHMQQAYSFILHSTKVEDGLAALHIIANMFTEEAGKIVDEVNLDVVFDKSQLQNELIDVHALELNIPLELDNLIPMVPLEFLKAITSNFSTKSELGRGGYGVVYKGVLPSGEIIAVKKLFAETHLLQDETFQNEVNNLNRIKHKNIVQCVGYCAESSWDLIDQPSGRPIWTEITKRLMCFEYIPNKSLDKYISDKSSSLGWNMRYDIIKGIISGLHFLHEECRIVHLDLKPENVLIDATMMPKLADFGSSRIFRRQESQIITKNCVGSRAYMAPEYVFKGIVSFKADIFSLGVIIIQIVTGQTNYPFSRCTYFQRQLFSVNDSPPSTDRCFQHFVERVTEKWRKKFLSRPKCESIKMYTQQVRQCMAIALKCVDPSMEKRPTAEHIIQLLTTEDQGIFATDVSLEKLHDSHLNQYVPPQLPNKMAIKCDELLEQQFQDSNAEPRYLTLEFLKAITCDFSYERLFRERACKKTYKGFLQSGIIVAVTKLEEEYLFDDKCFRNEVNNLMAVKHQNIVRLLGYCSESSWQTIKLPDGKIIWAEEPKRLICHEYLCNGSLDEYIRDESSGLDWNRRYEIIKGICRGLRFLHEECRIAHVGLSALRILLDASMIPKISDFDLSTVFDDNNQSRITTDIRGGSIRYKAPEYILQGVITTKADIFSFGTIIIEIITGHSKCPPILSNDPDPASTATSRQHFIEEVLGRWRKIFESTPECKSVETCMQQVRQCITIAIECLEYNMEKRPTAKDIAQMLGAADD